MDIDDVPVMKNFKMNDLVPVILPASVWMGFWAGYISVERGSYWADLVIRAIQYSLLDPEFIREAKQALERERTNITPVSLGDLLGVASHVHDSNTDSESDPEAVTENRTMSEGYL